MSALALGAAGAWRVPLRMARRTARREPGRALMVILLIALPVAAVAGSVITGATSSAVPLRAAIVSLGSADGLMQWSGTPATALNVLGSGSDNGTSNGDGVNPPVLTEPASPLADLPRGSSAVPIQYAEGAVNYGGRPFRHVSLLEADLSDPIYSGAYSIVQGRLPRAPGEVVVSDELATRVELTSGNDLSVRRATTSSDELTSVPDLRVVGVVHDNAHRHINGTLYAAPGTLGLAQDADTARQYLVHVPGGLPWSTVLELGHAGWQTMSRQVLAHPPAGCTDRDHYCDANGPVSDFAFGSINSGTATVVVLATVMALLQIVLLVGPAFAVGLRRRRRDLGLLAVSGARPGQLRRVVLAEGVVLGSIGAVLGLLIAWIAVYFLRGTIERGGDDHWIGLPVLTPMIIVVAAFGLGTAIVAATQPARQAARTDAASAVGRGSLHLSAREGSRRVRILGSAAVVLGTALVIGVGIARAGGGGFSATSSTIPLMVGCIMAELGIVTLAPTIIALVARLADRLLLTPRLALRDAARNRLRSGAAVAAVTAAMAGSVAALLYSTSTAAAADAAYRPYAPVGSVILPIYGSEDAQETDALRVQLTKALPLKGVWSVPVLQAGVGGPKSDSAVVQVVPPASGLCPADVLNAQGVTDDQKLADASADPRCGDQRRYGNSILNGSPVGNADLLAAITGVDSPEARRVLDAGGAVVFSKYLASDGIATIQVNKVTDGTTPTVTPLRTTTTPVYVLDHGFAPGTIFLSPALADRLGATYSGAAVYGTLARHVSGSQVDAANAVVARLLGPDNGNPLTVEQGRPPTSTDLLLGAVVLVAALLAIAAAVTAGGLALSDSRRDLATLAAVGAPPRLRRRLAASQAGVLTLIGCVLGVGAGFLPGWSMVHATQAPFVVERASFVPLSVTGRPVATALVVPWGWIGVLLLGLPVLTALVVGLAVRSRIPLNRRVD